MMMMMMNVDSFHGLGVCRAGRCDKQRRSACTSTRPSYGAVVLPSWAFATTRMIDAPTSETEAFAKNYASRGCGSSLAKSSFGSNSIGVQRAFHGPWMARTVSKSRMMRILPSPRSDTKNPVVGILLTSAFPMQRLFYPPRRFGTMVLRGVGRNEGKMSHPRLVVGTADKTDPHPRGGQHPSEVVRSTTG